MRWISNFGRRGMIALGLLVATSNGAHAQTGACCTPLPESSRRECTLRTLAECCAASGTYYGDRTTCSPAAYCGQSRLPTPVPCPSGACCIPASGSLPASCDLRNFSECCAAAGQYYGDGSACQPTTCGAPSAFGCPQLTGPAGLRSLGAFSKYLNPSGTGGTPVLPGTEPGGTLCGMGGVICAPNPFGKGQFKFELTEINEADLLLGDGPPPPRFTVRPMGLTPAGGFGLGERAGYAGDPCPAAGPKSGVFWPFRDALEIPANGEPCTNADGIMVTPFGSTLAIMLGGEARGGPAEELPGYPRGVDQLGRGVIDEQEMVRFGAFEIIASGGQQRLAKLRLGAGCVDVSVEQPGGSWSVQRNVQVLPRTELLVIPGTTPLINGAAVNGLAAFYQGEYPPTPVVVQDTNTSAGDEMDDDDRNSRSGGSELDAMYATIVTRNGRGEEIPPSLQLFLSGNLLGSVMNPSLGENPAAFANLEIFFDTIEGEGQHTLRGDNATVADGALNRMGKKAPGNGNATPGPDGPGLTFEPGCDPDFYTNVSLRTSDGFDFDLFISHAKLPTDGHGDGWFVGSIDNGLFMSTADGLLQGGDAGAPALRASISNANFDGVVAGNGPANKAAAEAVNTGVELLIPLTALGNPSGKFRIVAFINSQDHGLISNQVLPGIGGGGPLGEPRRVDFGTVRNMQCATIYPPKNPLWKNGDFDRRAAQLSMVGADQNWDLFARITADDFTLCDGQIHGIDTITGTLTTDAQVPKAAVVIWENCDGRPNLSRPIAILSSAPQVLEGRGLPLAPGEIVLHDDGGAFDSFRILNVEAHFEKPVFLRGGTYWVSIIGFSGTGNPLEQFFWGTSGDQVVKGRPGQFYDSDVGAWEDIDLLCCGCTDFNFCIGGSSCKILFDNAAPRLSHSGDFYATPSLQNGARNSDKSRSASDVVAPPCDPIDVCYVEGYVWTNCDRVGLEIYSSSCDAPQFAPPVAGPYLADCVTDTGERAFAPGTGIELKLLKASFYTFPTVRPPAGTNFWISLYALGDSAQNARGYFALGDHCDRTCDRLFNAPMVRGPAFDHSFWREASTALSLHDHAMMIAVREAPRVRTLPPASIDCPADINNSGDASIQDIFDFLAAWLTGCP